MDEYYHKYYDEQNKYKYDCFINFAQHASDPCQFLSKAYSNEYVSDNERLINLNRIPVSQDASASGYQIMSYLLLNPEMGKQTNLLPSYDNEIKDLYLCLNNELKEFLFRNLIWVG